MSASRLNKHLYTEITKLKLCNKPDAKARFLVTKSPFDGIDDDTQPSEDVQSKEYVIVGRIYPKSPIYNEAAFEIELVLPATFPQVPPLVRFLTRIYHPNVEADGKFCHDLLLKTVQWKADKSLVDVVEIVVNRIDNPNLYYTSDLDIGKEYTENRFEFNRKAAAFVKEYGLPRE